MFHGSQHVGFRISTILQINQQLPRRIDARRDWARMGRAGWLGAGFSRPGQGDTPRGYLAAHRSIGYGPYGDRLGRAVIP